MWETKIYHPLFAAGSRICTCLLTPPNDTTCKSVSEVMRDVLLLLEHPNYCTKCDHCPVNELAHTEMKTDLAFFLRKARAHTPNADPPTDEELRGGMSFSNFLPLLTTGAFSDVKLVSRLFVHIFVAVCQSPRPCQLLFMITVSVLTCPQVVDKTVFRCHRTVLAARSPVFRAMFDHGSDGGTIRVTANTDPRAMARFLQFLYGSVPTGRDAVDVNVHFALSQLAREYQVKDLHYHHVACLARRLNADNRLALLTAAAAVDDALLMRGLTLAAEALDAQAEKQGSHPHGPVLRRNSALARRAAVSPY
jgi:hypothetical protein